MLLTCLKTAATVALQTADAFAMELCKCISSAVPGVHADFMPCLMRVALISGCRVLVLLQVWDFNRSAEMRDTEGGASKRSVKEQVQKLKTYMAHETSAH